MSSAAVAAPVRPLARAVPMALAGVVVASVAFAAVLPIVARATDVELVNEGSALVQTEGTLVLHRTTVSGPVSAGGNLANTGESRITGGAVAVPRVAGGSREVQLYVGGTPVWADSAEQLLVSGAGGIAVADLSQTDLDDTGTDIVLTPQGSTPADASIRGTFDQGADGVSAADLVVDTAGTFEGYRDRSDDLATCEQTVTVDDDGVVYLQPGITNVWNVTEEYIDAQLAALNLSPAPSADTKLIVNITDAAGRSLSLPWGMTEEISSHVLYNFVGEGRVAFAGVRGIRGTVYAPGFDVTSGNPGVIQGNVIARSFEVDDRRGGGMRIENYPFVGPVECGEAVVAPTPPPATTADGSTTAGTTTGATPTTTTAPTDVTATTAPGSAITATTGPTTTGSATAGTVTTGTATTGTVAAGTTTPATLPGSMTGESATTGTPAGTASTNTTGAQTTGTAGAGTATTATSSTAASSTTASTTTASVPPTAGTAVTNPVTTSTTPATQPASAGDPATAPSATAGTTTPTTTNPTPAGVDGGTVVTTPATGTATAAGPTASTTSSSTPTTGATTATTATPALPGALVTTSTTSPADPLAAGDPVVPGAGTSAASASVTSGGSASLAAASATRPGSAPARIAFTGADVAGLVLTGLGLLAAGVGMTWTTRRQNAAGRHIA